MRSGYFLSTLLFFAVCTSTNAAYTNNMQGTPTAVLTYLNGKILLRLDRMYARLLAAYTQKQPVNIGYDDGTRSDSECASGYIKVHRVG